MRKSLLLASAFVLIATLGAHAEVKLIGSTLGTGLKISKDVNISPGSIFYETNLGKTYLTMDPKSSSTAEWRWQMQDGRTITIRTEPRNIGCKITFSASPDKDIVRWGYSVDASPHEYFTGIMERTVDGGQAESWAPGIATAMDMHGQKVEMRVKPTTAVYDSFYLSNRGYGLAVNTTWPGVFDFCKANPGMVQIEFEGKSLASRFYFSNNPAAIVKAHAMESGPPILPPKWALTPWRWRDEHTNRKTYFDGTKVEAPYNSQVMEDMLMMEAYGIPCGVYWLDRPWGPGGDGYDDMKWDDKRFPNHDAMIKWFDSKNTKLLLWIAPWTEGEISGIARAKGYDYPAGHSGTGNNRCLIDFTNPEGKEWWQGYIGALLKEGIAGFKLDRSEEGIPNGLDTFAHDGRTSREIQNDYPVEYLRSTYEIAKKVRGDDFVLMPRAAFTGSTRYGAFWGGDINGTEWGLRASIIAVQKSAVLGYPLWGSDTCGYLAYAEPETCERWLGFSAFCPIMEVGPTDNRAFWDMGKTHTSNPELIAAWRFYAKLHTSLADYSYKYAGEAHKTGMPIVRPLFTVFPAQRDAWIDWQTYMYGNDILVSPTWEKGVNTKKLYLPAGHKWIDAWDTTKVYEGGKYITVSAPAYKIPLFIREGSKVKLGDLEGLYKESLAIAQTKPDLAKLQKTVR